MTALAQFEGSILCWIQQNLRAPFFEGLSKALSFLGEAGMFWILLTLALMAFKKTRRDGIYCGVSILLTFIVVNLIIKPLVFRTRPYDLFETLVPLGVVPHDGSFPSGHSANAFSCAWVLFRRAKTTRAAAVRKIGVPALILAILISLSRIYSTIHFPTDVLVGALIGIVMSEISIRCFRKPVRKLMGCLSKKGL